MSDDEAAERARAEALAAYEGIRRWLASLYDGPAAPTYDDAGLRPPPRSIHAAEPEEREETRARAEAQEAADRWEARGGLRAGRKTRVLA